MLPGRLGVGGGRIVIKDVIFAEAIRAGKIARASVAPYNPARKLYARLGVTELPSTGDSPMIEVDKASNVLNIDGEFQRVMPIQARRNYSDFLELTPGVISRGFDDGSGRQVYFGHATEHGPVHAGPCGLVS